MMNSPGTASGYLLSVGLPLLLLSLAAGCQVQVHRYSSSFKSSYEATGRPGSSAAALPDEHQLRFRYQTRDGQAALESERVVLVFHGLSSEQQRHFHFQGEQQSIQIAGPGTCLVTTTCTSGKTTIAFCSNYTEGTNTLQFGEQKVRLVCEGRLLLAGEQAVDLTEGRKVVHLQGDKVKLE